MKNLLYLLVLRVPQNNVYVSKSYLRWLFFFLIKKKQVPLLHLSTSYFFLTPSVFIMLIAVYANWPHQVAHNFERVLQ